MRKKKRKKIAGWESARSIMVKELTLYFSMTGKKNIKIDIKNGEPIIFKFSNSYEWISKINKIVKNPSTLDQNVDSPNAMLKRGTWMIISGIIMLCIVPLIIMLAGGILLISIGFAVIPIVQGVKLREQAMELKKKLAQNE